MYGQEKSEQNLHLYTKITTFVHLIQNQNNN